MGSKTCLRVPASLVVFVSVLVSVYAIESYTYYESAELGHARETNGTLIWGELSEIEGSGSTGETRSDGWDITVKFAVSIVDSVQTQAFPYDLLRRILRNDYSKSEVLGYQTNVIVVTSLGCALALSILMVLVIYFIRRCRRGGKDEFLVHVAHIVARQHRVILGLGAAIMLVDFIFVLCSLTTSTQALMGALDLEVPINDSMQDVSNYFVAMQEHYNFIATNTSQWFINEVMISDMNDVGRLIWETGRDEFLPVINPTIQLVSDLDSKAEQSVGFLSTMYSDMQTAMSDVVSGVDAVLTKVHFNLTNAVTDYTCVGCDGSCSGCSAIVPDDIFLNCDFSTLPSILSNIDSLTSLISTNTRGTSQDPAYYLFYGIGEVLTNDGNVTAAKDELIQGLLSWQNAWGNATNNILFPNESVFWFDTLRPKWQDFYHDLKTQEIVRYTFTMLVCLLTVAVMALTVASVVVAARRGLFHLKKTGDEDFVRTQKDGWMLSLASCHMLLAAVGFYAGANLEKAVCQPGRSLGAAQKVIDYEDAMPGHPGIYLSDVLLGNGTLGPIRLAEVLTSCANGSAAYETFLHHLVVPTIQDDLQDYTQHFGNLTEVFDRMRVSLPSNTTLVPPDFVTWVDDFTTFNNFNHSLYNTMLSGNVINADVDTYTDNIQVIYDSGLPFEPSKSRLTSAIDVLQGQKAKISVVNGIKNDLASIFNDYTTSVKDIRTTANQTMEQLLALEPALIAMSGPAISRGVDKYYSEFIAALDNAANTTWQWVGEAAPCEQVSDAYDAALTSFCDQYSDYVNASWLLLGHTCLFMLTLSAVTFFIYRAMPGPKDHTDLDVDAKTRILMIENKNQDSGMAKDTQPIIAINRDLQKPEQQQGTDNKAFSLLDDLSSCASPAPASTTIGRYRKGGRTRRISPDAWIDSRRSYVTTPNGIVLQKNDVSSESLA